MTPELFHRVAVVALAAVSAGCALPAQLARSPYSVIADARLPVPDPVVSQEEWTLARDRLGRLRGQLPTRPYVQRVRIGVVDPRSGKLFQGRGALAVSPNRAARLVLLGPGGTTALDVWVTSDRFRFAIPALDIDKRGNADPVEAAGLPIGFLRWWLLSPLAGQLVLARSNRAESAFILRDARATVTVRTDGRRFVALRREGTRLEGIEWSAHGLRPVAGANGVYVDGQWGTKLHVVVEEVLPDEPDPGAFVDPTAPETAL